MLQLHQSTSSTCYQTVSSQDNISLHTINYMQKRNYTTSSTNIVNQRCISIKLFDVMH